MKSLRSADVALIEERRLIRDGFAALLSQHAPELSVSAFSKPDEIGALDARLAVIWINAFTEAHSQGCKEKVDALRAKQPGVKILAFVEGDDPLPVRRAFDMDIDLARVESTTKEAAIGCVKLALAGGRFVSSEFVNSSLFEGRSTPSATRAAPVYDMRGQQLGGAAAQWRITPRELEILALLDRGMQNKTIAFELGISSCTVKVHVRNIMKKLRAANRTQVAFRVRQLARLSPDRRN